MNAHVRDNLNFLKLNIALETATELTLDTNGIITKAYSHHTVDTFEDAASDNLVTISGGAEGEVILLRAAHTDRTVVLKTGTGNIINPSGIDVTLNDTNDYCLLAHNGTNWIVIGGGAESDLAAHVAAADPHTGYVLESSHNTVTIQTTTYTVLSTDNLVVCNSTTAFTVTLPAASGSGKIYHIKNINSGTITLEGNSSDTIDGDLNVPIIQWDDVSVIDYAANKWVIV
jgi:hypothetical protein